MLRNTMSPNRSERKDVANGLREDISRAIRERRAGLRLTQEQVATLAGVSAPRIVEIESGRFRGRFDTLARVAGALGMSITLTDVAA